MEWGHETGRSQLSWSFVNQARDMGFILEVMECGQIWKNDGFISIFEFFLAIIQDKD